METPSQPQPDSGIKTNDQGEELNGILGYVGTTGSGKTHLAFLHLQRLHKSGVHCVVIEGVMVDNFEHLPMLKNAREVLISLYSKEQKEIPAWVPRDEMELDAFLNAVMEAKPEQGIAILIDEVSFWKKSKNLPFLFRTWRHSKSTILVTSQHVSADLGQVLFGCNPKLYIFRTTAPRSLKWLEDWHGLEPNQIREMQDWHYLEKRF